MRKLRERMQIVEQNIKQDQITVMIIGLGSVGGFLLDYLLSKGDSAMRIVIVGRNEEKIKKRVNISQVAAIIRNQSRAHVEIMADVDLNDVAQIKDAIKAADPDFIVNSSRAYSGLKYGTISWTNVRAYGIWTPLSIRYTKNIMEAFEQADSHAIVINTSYSDAVIPWLASAGKAYPDFGSGNLNHLVPRLKLAAADMLQVSDYWNVNVVLAAGHFHDVCISKEGQTEGVDIPLKVFYKNEEAELDKNILIERCSIPMPTDANRNMMNASSNFAIIDACIQAVRKQETFRVFSPGVFGNLGGYPVMIGYDEKGYNAWLDTSVFSLEEMQKVNRESMDLDGIEKIQDGSLFYTDYLIEKAQKAFGVTLPKEVPFAEIEQTAQFIIEKIILPNVH